MDGSDILAAVVILGEEYGRAAAQMARQAETVRLLQARNAALVELVEGLQQQVGDFKSGKVTPFPSPSPQPGAPQPA